MLTHRWGIRPVLAAIASKARRDTTSWNALTATTRLPGCRCGSTTPAPPWPIACFVTSKISPRVTLTCNVPIAIRLLIGDWYSSITMSSAQGSAVPATAMSFRKITTTPPVQSAITPAPGYRPNSTTVRLTPPIVSPATRTMPLPTTIPCCVPLATIRIAGLRRFSIMSL